ncbi:MAG: Nif3-like dinuclear metal center hexameric protein [Oscillospiraceae bacterium]|nr:Nif3-like dinuclear metal center hexameric protein [Oscillospiraceae bacterium]
MKATELYNTLEKDFITSDFTEDWYNDNWETKDFICDNFKQRSLGLLCDFAVEINKVYTAVFPSDNVLQKILDDKTTDAMLFLHHPLVWDLSINRKNPDSVFYEINAELLKELKKRRISLFNYHLPLDNFSEYSTSKTLADALGVKIEKAFGNYFGAECGIIGTTDCKTVQELNERFSQVVGHETKLYQYGSDEIKDNRVSICAGGGNDMEIVSKLVAFGVNTHIVGISRHSIYSEEAHNFEKENGINLLGGTHYSSEKYACIAMCNYFQKLGIESEFISDIPCLEDL